MKRATFNIMLVAMLLAALVLGFWFGRTHPDQAPSEGQRSGTEPSAMTEARTASGTAPVSHPVPADVAPAAPTPPRPVLYWYDPMEPAQHFAHPGKSPFMDMQLVPKYADPVDTTKDLVVSAAITQNLGMRLAQVERASLQTSLSVPAVVQLNDRDVAVVQLRAAGFVQKVYNHAVNDELSAGAPLADVLIPEWVGAQEEFLAVLRDGDPAFATAARQRLQLLGMSEAQVERVARNKQPEALLTITTPISGVITELNARTGMTLAQGATVARINGIRTVWVEAALPEAQAADAHLGQAVELTFSARPGQLLKGRISALLPQADSATRTLRLRVEVPNAGGQLRPGMFAQMRLLQPAADLQLLVPSEAVIRTGTRNLLMVSTGKGHFRATEVVLGSDNGDKTVILAGVQAGEMVVASGQFLLDSEASLRGLRPPPTPGPGPEGSAAHPPAGTQ